MAFISFFLNYKFALVSCTNSEFSNFYVLHLNYEKFKLCLQNTLNMSKTIRVYLRVLQCTCGKILIYGFRCSHIIAACQHQCVDFRLFVQGYYTTQSYYDTWASLFHPIFNEDELALYDGPTIVPHESMKRIGSGRPKSTWLHNEMDVRVGKTNITCGLCKQPGHNRRSCKNINQVQ